MEILEKTLDSYPLVDDDGKYPEGLRGNLFFISGIDQVQYVTNDGLGIWGFPKELYNEIQKLIDCVDQAVEQELDKPLFDIVPEPKEKVPVRDIVLLADNFGTDGILRLWHEGII